MILLFSPMLHPCPSIMPPGLEGILNAYVVSRIRAIILVLQQLHCEAIMMCLQLHMLTTTYSNTVEVPTRATCESSILIELFLTTSIRSTLQLVHHPLTLVIYFYFSYVATISLKISQ